MIETQEDDRNEERRRLDDQLATEPRKPRPPVAADEGPKPMESFLRPEDLPRPKAAVGVIEKGVVRPLDEELRLPEHRRVLIVGDW